MFANLSRLDLAMNSWYLLVKVMLDVTCLCQAFQIRQITDLKENQYIEVELRFSLRYQILCAHDNILNVCAVN